MISFWNFLKVLGHELLSKLSYILLWVNMFLCLHYHVMNLICYSKNLLLHILCNFLFFQNGHQKFYQILYFCPLIFINIFLVENLHFLKYIKMVFLELVSKFKLPFFHHHFQNLNFLIKLKHIIVTLLPQVLYHIT